MCAHFQPKAVFERLILNPFQLGILAVFVMQKGDKAVEIGFARRFAAVKARFALFTVIRHDLRPFPPHRGTGGMLRPYPG